MRAAENFVTRGIGVLLVLALFGCPVPDKQGSTTGTTGTTGSATTGPAETSGPTPTPTTTGATSTTAPGSTGPAESGTSDAGTTTDASTTGEPLSICDPQPVAVRAEFMLDREQFPRSSAISVHCTVTGLSEDATLTIDLSECKQDPDDVDEIAVVHTLTAEVAPGGPIDLQVGEAVVLSHFVDAPWWSNRFVTLRRPSSELVLAGLAGAYVQDDQDGPPADFFAPFELQRIEVCPFEPIVEEESGCSFICGADCYQLRREAVRVRWKDGATVELIDRSAQPWPDQPYRVVVGAAETHLDLGKCSDQSGGWFKVMFLRVKP